MASKQPIDQEYVDWLKEQTSQTLCWLIEQLEAAQSEFSHLPDKFHLTSLAGDPIEHFKVFKQRIPDMTLETLAIRDGYPTLLTGRNSLMDKWIFTHDPERRKLLCRIKHYHQAYFEIARTFKLYNDFRIKRVKEAPDQAIIEKNVSQDLKKQVVKRKLGFRRHPIFFWTGSYVD